MTPTLPFLATLLCLLLNTVHAKQCSATAYYHKKVAYDSGIYFRHADVYHAGSYGHFWDEVNVTATKNLGLKRMTRGYDKDMVGYIWGNAIDYGYVGSGKGYVLGLQAAVGSLAGMTTPEVAQAFSSSHLGNSSVTFNRTSGFPDVASPAGASTLTGWATVMNRTVIETAIGTITPENDDDNPTGVTPTQQKQRRAGTAWPEKRGNSDADDECNDEDEEPEPEDDDECDAQSDNNPLTWAHSPHQSVVYHAPWRSSKPVFFHGQCDNCDKKTGFTEHGHGKFQSCSLIYNGKEYLGKPGHSDDDDLNTCVVDFDCA